MKKHVLSILLACALLLPALAGCIGKPVSSPPQTGEDETDLAPISENATSADVIVLPEIEDKPETVPITEPTFIETEGPEDGKTPEDVKTPEDDKKPADVEAPEIPVEYFPNVNTEKSASLLDALPNLGMENDDPRLLYVRAFVTGDVDLLEQVCGVQAGMYKPYRTLDLSAWFAWIGTGEEEGQLKFAFYPVRSDVDAFPANAWTEGSVYESPAGAQFYRPKTERSFGEAADELTRLLGYRLRDLPATDDMDADTRFLLTCYIYHKLGSDYNSVEENYKLYAKKHFGIENFTPEEAHVKYGCAHGGFFQPMDILDSKEQKSETVVTVQFYSDVSETVKSHVYEYTMKKVDDGWCFTGWKVIRQGEYEAIAITW